MEYPLWILIILFAFAAFVYFFVFRSSPAQLIGPIQVKSTNSGGKPLAPLSLSLFKQPNGALVISTNGSQDLQTMYPQNQLWLNWWYDDGKPYLPHGKTLAEVNIVLDPLTTNMDLSKAAFTKDALSAILNWNNILLAIQCPCPSKFGFSTASDIIVIVPANLVK